MPVASPDAYLEMLDRAKSQGFAYPAINVSSSSTAIAALQGLQQAGSDGILQVSTGGAEYWSGSTVKSMAIGAQGMAAFIREAAKGYGVSVALHTDHCAKHQLDGFVRPLLEISAERVKNGQEPLFNSHMWDGSAVPLGENLEIAKQTIRANKAIEQVKTENTDRAAGLNAILKLGKDNPIIQAQIAKDFEDTKAKVSLEEFSKQLDEALVAVENKQQIPDNNIFKDQKNQNIAIEMGEKYYTPPNN
jgi:hypothetical protein